MSQQQLQDVFLQYCDATKKGSKTASDKTMKKILTDSKLFGKNLNSTEMDITFRKVLGNKAKELDFAGFQAVLKALASSYLKDHPSLGGVDEAYQKMCDEIVAHPPVAHGATKVSSDAATQRMTDASGYTGSHKERFDADGKGKGKEGRADVADNSGYVGGYKEANTYDKKH